METWNSMYVCLILIFIKFIITIAYIFHKRYRKYHHLVLEFSNLTIYGSLLSVIFTYSDLNETDQFNFIPLSSLIVLLNHASTAVFSSDLEKIIGMTPNSILINLLLRNLQIIGLITTIYLSYSLLIIVYLTLTIILIATSIFINVGMIYLENKNFPLAIIASTSFEIFIQLCMWIKIAIDAILSSNGISYQGILILENSGVVIAPLFIYFMISICHIISFKYIKILDEKIVVIKIIEVIEVIEVKNVD